MIRICLTCSKEFKKPPCRIKIGAGKYCSRLCKNIASKGKHFSPKTEIKKGVRISITTEFLKGHKPSKHKENCRCFRCTRISPTKKGNIPWNKGLTGIPNKSKGIKRPHKSGMNNHNWKGGITSEIRKFRNSTQYQDWRKEVFKRDNYECQICGQIGGELRANHIKKFSNYPELRLEPTNGITICKKCDLQFVYWHEEEWESYFNFNLMVRGILYA